MATFLCLSLVLVSAIRSRKSGVARVEITTVDGEVDGADTDDDTDDAMDDDASLAGLADFSLGLGLDLADFFLLGTQFVYTSLYTRSRLFFGAIPLAFPPDDLVVDCRAPYVTLLHLPVYPFPPLTDIVTMLQSQRNRVDPECLGNAGHGRAIVAGFENMHDHFVNSVSGDVGRVGDQFVFGRMLGLPLMFMFGHKCHSLSQSVKQLHNRSRHSARSSTG